MALSLKEIAAAKQLMSDGYSPAAVAMRFGGPVGSPDYYTCLMQLEIKLETTCPYCGEMCFGTGDCNCHED